MASAADVPHVYDVVLNGQGYVFLDTITPNLPFRTHKATYTTSPTFIDRSNVTGAFGDNQQEWWLTASQNDWSLGEEQKFFRIGDSVSRSRYWRGMNVDLSVTGQVSIAQDSTTITFASPVGSVVVFPNKNISQPFNVFGTADLFTVDKNGATVTNNGAHGAGGKPTTACSDGVLVYFSGFSCTSVRTWNSSVFATFSPSPAASLAVLNNTLYGAPLNSSTYGFGRYDTTGAFTSLFQWKTANGGVIGPEELKLLPYGGHLMLIRTTLGPAELWTYDGNATYKVLDFEQNFLFDDACVSQGVLFFVGLGQKQGFNRVELRYFANGSTGLAYASQWLPTSTVTGSKRFISPFGLGVVFGDPMYGATMYFDLSAGSASTFAPFPVATGASYGLSMGQLSGVLVNGTSYATSYFASTAASAASLQTSLIDFESSLDKLVRSVRVDFIPATTGDGGAIDLYYTTNDITSSLASIATSISTSTDYPINVSCRSISLLVVLRRGTSTTGPTLKRIYVRAAPVLQQFKRREFIIDCTGDYGTVRELRDGTPMPVTGASQAASLVALSQQTTPFSVTDRFGTYNALVDLNDPEGFEAYEIHAAQEQPASSGAYVVRLKLKEV